MNSNNNFGRNNRNNNNRNYNNTRPNNSQLEYKVLDNNTYVDYAQSVINHLNNSGGRLLTTSQIRNLLSLNSEIYNIVTMENQKQLSENVKAKLQYLKVRMVYDSGREPSVKAFILNSHLIDHINWIGDSKERYMLFSKYMEALVAYRKFEGYDS